MNNYKLKDAFKRPDTWQNGVLNAAYRVLSYVSLRENITRKPPDHVPEQIANVYMEGATCLAVGCFNAAGTMFRLCLDLATRGFLPTPTEEGAQVPAGEPNRRQRRDLGMRLPWLFENGKLPPELRELSDVVKEDGNDGAHAGNLTKHDAEDLADFTEALLARLFTEAGRLAEARQRRAERRALD